ncbi:MAG: hypothetical protein ACI80V_002532 [Rhodothermales bacterium]
MRTPSARFQAIRLPLLAVILAVLVLPGCKTLQQFSALKSVDFSLNSVNNVVLAGLNLDRVRSYQDLNLLDAAKLAAAFSRKDLPLSFTVNLAATNPADNPVSARMVGMDWSLLLDDRETISGTFNDPMDLPPGVEVGIPITVQLNLIQFFDQSAGDLFELVQAIAGQNGSPKRIAIKARPTINTPIGPIRYPNAITVISREVGS